MKFHHRPFADRDLEQPRCVFDEGIEVEPLDDKSPLAGVSEHLFAQVRRPHRRDLDLLEERLHWRFRGQIHAREARVAEHAGEEIVEIVRDATGENPEALELLGLLEFALEEQLLGGRSSPGLLGGDAIGHVLDEGEDGKAFPLVVVQYGILPHAMNDPPRFGEIAVLAKIALLGAVDQSARHIADLARVVGKNKSPIGKVLADDLFGRPSEDLLGLPGPTGHAKIRPPLDHRERGILDVVDETQLRRAQFFSGALDVGDVARDSDQSHNRAIHVLQRKLRGQKPASLATRSLKRLLTIDDSLPGLDHGHIIGVISFGMGAQPG